MESESRREVLVCPFYKEVCVDGFCKSMGEDAHGTRYKCRQWVHVVGKDPQSLKQIDWYDCSFAWTPTLLLEGSQMTRQNTASTDKVANLLYHILPPEAREQLAVSLIPPEVPVEVKQLK